MPLYDAWLGSSGEGESLLEMSGAVPPDGGVWGKLLRAVLQDMPRYSTGFLQSAAVVPTRLATALVLFSQTPPTYRFSREIRAYALPVGYSPVLVTLTMQLWGAGGIEETELSDLGEALHAAELLLEAHPDTTA